MHALVIKFVSSDMQVHVFIGSYNSLYFGVKYKCILVTEDDITTLNKIFKLNYRTISNKTVMKHLKINLKDSCRL